MLLLFFKLIKYIGVSLFAGGIYGALSAQSPKQRDLAAHWISGLGFLLVWLAGFGMMKLQGHSMSAGWISSTILLNLLCLLALLASTNSKRWRPWTGAIASTAFIASLIMMIYRTTSPIMPLVTILPIVWVATFYGLRSLVQTHQDESQRSRESLLHWFSWIAKVEGVTLLVLFGVYMPMKYIFKINLDGGQGWFGWIHGIFQMTYVVGLIVAAQRCRWSALQGILGFIASLLPFGTFIFERKVIHPSRDQ